MSTLFSFSTLSFLGSVIRFSSRHRSFTVSDRNFERCMPRKGRDGKGVYYFQTLLRVVNLEAVHYSAMHFEKLFLESSPQAFLKQQEKCRTINNTECLKWVVTRFISYIIYPKCLFSFLFYAFCELFTKNEIKY